MDTKEFQEIIAAGFIFVSICGLLMGALKGAISAVHKRIKTPPASMLSTAASIPWKPKTSLWACMGALIVAPAAIAGFTLTALLFGLIASLFGAIVGLYAGIKLFDTVFAQSERRHYETLS